MDRISYYIKSVIYAFTVIILLIASVLSYAGNKASEQSDIQILLNVSAIIVDGEKGINSSTRRVEEIERMFSRVNQVWFGTFIKFELTSVTRLTVTDNVLTELFNGNYGPFIKYLSNQKLLNSDNHIMAIYAHKIGGMNGRAVSADNLIFITDYPYVEDYRVTSHEIGHILGLSHDVTDSGRLMYSGSDGINLMPDEISLARDNALKLSSNTVLNR